MRKLFEGKMFLVTGGSCGIGLEICEHINSEGGLPVVVSRSKPEHDFPWIEFDFSIGDTPELSDGIRNLLGPSAALHGIVNNVGVSKWCSLDRLSQNEFIETQKVNLFSSVITWQACRDRLVPHSSIVNISSIAGKRGTVNNFNYCASKFGVEAFLRVAMLECPRDIEGIRVNNICPVLIETPGLLEALVQPGAPAECADVKDFLGNFARANTAIGRLPVLADVARLCSFLLSDQAASITGQSINVDCGVFPG